MGNRAMGSFNILIDCVLVLLFSFRRYWATALLDNNNLTFVKLSVTYYSPQYFAQLFA